MYSSLLIWDVENSLSEDTKLTTLLCKWNTAIVHLWNEFSNYPILALNCMIFKNALTEKKIKLKIISKI
jgi:hypothetical protein